MYRLVILAFIVLAPSAWAQGRCSYDNPTACGSPGINNAHIGGTLNVDGSSTLNGGTISGTYSGDFTATGSPTFTGNPTFSGTPTFTGQPFFTAYSATDASGTIAAGGTAQTLMTSSASRKGCSVQNLSTQDLWVSNVGTAAASQPSQWIPPGSEWSCPFNTSTAAISIFGASTGQAFAARAWQ